MKGNKTILNFLKLLRSGAIGFVRLFSQKDIIFTFIASIIIGVSTLILHSSFSLFEAPSKKGNIELQIVKLDEIENSLMELQEFITNQKDKLRKTETLVASLKEEKLKLEPIVKANRETINSLLKLQQENYHKQIWTERVFGFFIGFASSLFASSIFITVRRLLSGRSSAKQDSV